MNRVYLLPTLNTEFFLKVPHNLKKKSGKSSEVGVVLEQFPNRICYVRGVLTLWLTIR